MIDRRAVTIVGIGDDGCSSLSSRAMNAVAAAQVLAGGERHLAFFPQFKGERIVLEGGIVKAVRRLAELAHEHNVCVLASGDPLFYGVGKLVINAVGREHVAVIPQPSSMQLAFARVGVSWEDAACISLHGRPIAGLAAKMRRLAKAAILTDDESPPARIANHLLAHGESAAITAWVCERLGGDGERVRSFKLPELVNVTDVDSLNIVILVRDDPAWRPEPLVYGRSEDAFAKRVPKKGLITKREVRLLSLAALQLRPSSVVWDIGAGSGSIAVEAGLIASEGRVYAIEVDPEGVEICRENVAAHGADNVTVIAGRAPNALQGLETPDAVFVGGSKGSMADIIDVALSRLAPGGRLVANAITLENAGEAYQALRKHGLVPEVMLVQISRAEKLAHYLRYEAQNPIQIFAVEKPLDTLAPEPAEEKAP